VSSDPCLQVLALHRRVQAFSAQNTATSEGLLQRVREGADAVAAALRGRCEAVLRGADGAPDSPPTDAPPSPSKRHAAAAAAARAAVAATDPASFAVLHRHAKILCELDYPGLPGAAKGGGGGGGGGARAALGPVTVEQRAAYREHMRAAFARQLVRLPPLVPPSYSYTLCISEVLSLSPTPGVSPSVPIPIPHFVVRRRRCSGGTCNGAARSTLTTPSRCPI